MVRGVMPCSALNSICLLRRRSVSAMARSIDPVRTSAYRIALPRMWRAARRCLDQRTLGAQKSLLVGIEDRDQGYLRHVETLAQQIDADDHVETFPAAGRE